MVSVNGHNDGGHAIESISRTMFELPGSRGLLIAGKRPVSLPEHVEFVLIGSLNYQQYSMFMVHCLYYHVRTEYVLIVQDDGWALNGANWRDGWFDYDYIGAPTHAAGVDGKLCKWYSWIGQPAAIPVLNGGFSLRTRRFLEAPTKFGICYQTPGDPWLRNEDIQLCLILRESLERRGLKFAPPEAALHFSVEYMHPAIHSNLNLRNLFGHHAQTRRLKRNAVVEVGMDHEEIRRQYGETQILDLLQSYGYTVVCRR